MVVRAVAVVESEAVPATAQAQTLRKSRTVSAGGTGGSGLGPITCHDGLQTAVDGGDIPHKEKKVPVKSFRDDVARKTALHKVMGPDPDEKGGRLNGKRKETVEPNFGRTALGMADDDTDDVSPSDAQYTKEEVNYRYSGAESSCGNCVHFQFPGACEIVAGLIRPVDICNEFESTDDDQPSGVFQPDVPGEDAADEEGEATMMGGKKRLRDNAVQAIPVVQSVTVEGGPASQFGMIAGEVSPPGWSGTVKAMKKHPKISNPFALAWWMKDKGETPHYKPEKTTEVGWTDEARAAAAVARAHGFKKERGETPKQVQLRHANGDAVLLDKGSGKWAHYDYGQGNTPGRTGTFASELGKYLSRGMSSTPRASESIVRRLASLIALREDSHATRPLVEGGPGSGRHPGGGDVAVGGINPSAIRTHIRDPKKNTAMCGHRGNEPAVAQGMPNAQQLDRVTCPGCLNKYAGKLYRSSEDEGGPGSGRHKFAPDAPQSDEDRQVDRFTKREKPAERAARIASKKVDPASARAVKKYFSQAMLVEVREYSPDQPRDHGRWTKGGGSKGASGAKSAGGKKLNPGAQRAKDLAQARKGGGGGQPPAPAPAAKPSGPLNKGAQRAQHAAQARKDVHAAKIDQVTNQRIIDNLRQMGFFKSAEVESEFVSA